MNKVITILLFIFFINNVYAQTDSVLKKIQVFQNSLKEEYTDPYKTPLNPKSKKTFKGINFFPVNLKYNVQAKFVKTSNEKPFQMSTSSGMRKTYIKYAEVFFMIDAKQFKLNVYQSQELLKSADLKDYLFIPFTDATSGNETYEGGRYIDLTIPTSNTIVIDFNEAYHPYCAYTDGYNCPVPPQENSLPVKIEAGVKF